MGTGEHFGAGPAVEGASRPGLAWAGKKGTQVIYFGVLPFVIDRAFLRWFRMSMGWRS